MFACRAIKGLPLALRSTQPCFSTDTSTMLCNQLNHQSRFFASLLVLSSLILASSLVAQDADSSGNQSAFTAEPFQVTCEGTYPHHLQGVCADAASVYWSFTTTLVKTDHDGKVLKKIPVANHHGDLCFRDGKIYVAVNLGKFNDPAGNADSWVYVYDAESLKEIARHETQEVFHGAGGIGHRDGHFYVVGGLPDSVEDNYVYEYDNEFQFVKKHVVASGHTHLGIQSATFAHNRWWFGCYGSPAVTLVTDADFQMKGRHELNCSLGIEGLADGRLLVASGHCDKENGCSGKILSAQPSEAEGFQIQE